jgi:arsenite methyltransferase
VSSHSSDDIRRVVREHYGQTAVNAPGSGCCGPQPAASSCCGPQELPTADPTLSLKLGYSLEDVLAAPAGSNLGLGCGNPQAIAALQEGETVLDLGSGAGFDCFLAAHAVGPSGHVIGVDMTPEMVARSRAQAHETGFTNVEFRLGEIEALPVADGSVDVVISNCVVNLSPEKPRVFAEMFRALKPGGRVAISDVVASAPLPEEIRSDMALYAGCVSGASTKADLEKMLRKTGFEDVEIQPKEASRTFIKDWAPGTNIEDFVLSAVIAATKPH